MQLPKLLPFLPLVHCGLIPLLIPQLLETVQGNLTPQEDSSPSENEYVYPTSNRRNIERRAVPDVPETRTVLPRQATKSTESPIVLSARVLPVPLSPTTQENRPSQPEEIPVELPSQATVEPVLLGPTTQENIPVYKGIPDDSPPTATLLPIPLSPTTQENIPPAQQDTVLPSSVPPSSPLDSTLQLSMPTPQQAQQMTPTEKKTLNELFTQLHQVELAIVDAITGPSSPPESPFDSPLGPLDPIDEDSGNRGDVVDIIGSPKEGLYEPPRYTTPLTDNPQMSAIGIPNLVRSLSPIPTNRPTIHDGTPFPLAIDENEINGLAVNDLSEGVLTNNGDPTSTKTTITNTKINIKTKTIKTTITITSTATNDNLATLTDEPNP